MVGIFFIGVILTIFTSCITVSMLKDGYVKCIKSSYEDTPSLTIWFFILQIVGILMLYFGFVTPSSDISRVIDNKDGTITLTEYSISGDSIIKKKIKAPVEIYGVVTNIEHKNRWMGRMVYGYVEVTHKLNDGRVIVEEYSDSEFKENIKIGNSMKAVETFYPSHNIKFSY